MRLPLFRADITVIALWIGHEQLVTTNVYLNLEESYRMRESAGLTGQCVTGYGPYGGPPDRYGPDRPAPTCTAG